MKEVYNNKETLKQTEQDKSATEKAKLGEQLRELVRVKQDSESFTVDNKKYENTSRLSIFIMGLGAVTTIAGGIGIAIGGASVLLLSIDAVIMGGISVINGYYANKMHNELREKKKEL